VGNGQLTVDNEAPKSEIAVTNRSLSTVNCERTMDNEVRPKNEENGICVTLVNNEA